MVHLFTIMAHTRDENMNNMKGSNVVDMNDVIRRFHDYNVQLEEKETDVYEHIALPTVDKIMQYIHDRDERFSREPLRVGSYWQGLKVEKADEFDFSVILKGPYKCCLETSPKRRHYHMNTRIGVINKVPWCTDVVYSKQPLKEPEPGYFFIPYPEGTWPDSQDLVRFGDIVPYLVIKRLRELIRHAIRELDVKGDVHPCRKTHGPALTIHLTVDYRTVEVDLAPMIQRQMPFDHPALSIVWPHKGAQWPSKATKERIRNMGVNFVAKKDFNWMESFAEVEGELVAELPANRKLVLKVLKKLNTDFWSNNRDPEVSSYILKNVWFWEMERFPTDDFWGYWSIWSRLQNMTKVLLQAIQDRDLQQYFNPSTNLMTDKDPHELEVAAEKIKKFLKMPAEYLKIQSDEVTTQEEERRCPEEDRCTKCGDGQLLLVNSSSSCRRTV